MNGLTHVSSCCSTIPWSSWILSFTPAGQCFMSSCKSGMITFDPRRDLINCRLLLIECSLHASTIRPWWLLVTAPALAGVLIPADGMWVQEEHQKRFTRRGKMERVFAKCERSDGHWISLTELRKRYSWLNSFQFKLIIWQPRVERNPEVWIFFFKEQRHRLGYHQETRNRFGPRQ